LPPTSTRFGVTFGGGGAVLRPPITPPSTPPMDPPATPPGTPPAIPCMPASGGNSSSLMMFTSFGMAFGATSLPASIKRTAGLIFTTCTAAGGGGGGGGGGGASRMEDSMVLGNASV